ncbi:unnamed protein product, partial [Caretta caretta]
YRKMSQKKVVKQCIELVHSAASPGQDSSVVWEDNFLILL